MIGVLVFTGLTAWDTQRLKEEYLRRLAGAGETGRQGCDHGRAQPVPELHQPVHDAAPAVRLAAQLTASSPRRVRRGGPPRERWATRLSGGLRVLVAPRLWQLSLLLAWLHRLRAHCRGQLGRDPGGTARRSPRRRSSRPHRRPRLSEPSSCAPPARFRWHFRSAGCSRPAVSAERPQPAYSRWLGRRMRRGARIHAAAPGAALAWSTAAARPLDAEALEVRPGGTCSWATKKGPVFRPTHPAPGSRPKPRAAAGAFAAHRPTNEGLETLAKLPDGSLLAIAEGAWVGDGLHARSDGWARVGCRCAIVRPPVSSHRRRGRRRPAVRAGAPVVPVRWLAEPDRRCPAGRAADRRRRRISPVIELATISGPAWARTTRG